VQRIKELDGLRAIAILLVLCCHYEGIAALLCGLPEFGWMGVDIFFVLSGYLITTILLGLRGQQHAYKTFYSRRVIRIFPPYFAATAAVILIGLISHRYWVVSPSFFLKQAFFLQAFDRHQAELLIGLILHPWWHLTHLPNLLSYAHNLPKGWVGNEISLGAPAASYWSLSVEEYFYLLWAPVVLRCSRRAILTIGVFICLFAMAVRWSCGDIGAIVGVIYRFDALIYGAFLALLLERRRNSRLPAATRLVFYFLFFASVIGISWILFVLRPVVGYEIRQSPLFLVFGLPLISLATASSLGVIILRANSKWWLARLLRTGFMQFVGTISYTMYLVHMLAVLFISHMLRPFAHYIPRGYLLIEAFLSIILTIAAARLSWHYLEKPLLRWKDRHFPGTKVAEPTLS
jgi:peptidoglycan/LPS O-acetylase OafA/YrhL